MVKIKHPELGGGQLDRQRVPKNVGIGKFRKIGAIAAASLIAGTGISADVNQGFEKPYPPTEKAAFIDDNELVFATINLQGTAQSQSDIISTVNKILKKYNPDFLGTQEINSDDAKALMSYLNERGYSGYFIGADQIITASDDFGSYYGNLLISKAEPSSVDTERFDGTTDWGEVVTPDRLTHPLAGLGDVRQEMRAVVAADYEEIVNGRKIKLRVGDTHISGNNDRFKQRDRLRQFTERFLNSETRFNVLLGDFNAPPAQVEEFLKTTKGWQVNVTKPTNTDNMRQMDYVATRAGEKFEFPDGVLTQIKINVDRKIKTDHYLVIYKYGFQPFPETHNPND